jgi:hypothetical protein
MAGKAGRATEALLSLLRVCDGVSSMPLILKPMLKRASEGRFAASVQIDDADGRALGSVGPSLHASEADARNTLQGELEAHLAGVDSVIQVADRHFGHDAGSALAELVLPEPSAPGEQAAPAQDVESGTWRVAKTVLTG